MGGCLFVMTGASGVGKGTVRAKVLERTRLFYSISMTTRPPRPGERHGVDYYFVDRPRFEALLREGGLLEYAEYVGHLYGTPRLPVERALERGEDVLLEIEVQGALQVKAKVPEAVLIFLLPPSLSELKRRLVYRGQDSPEKIARRLEQAEWEIQDAHRFDYVVVNDVLEEAVADFLAILTAERRRTRRMARALSRALERDAELEAELEEILRREHGGTRDR
ncbi:guanylate kinase [Thermus thermamylovorans]|uniref:Guanylate kinase n=1 Tax=Thermus thermamylovorans TaxID=2509362 RepID=A0A4Q9B5D1_9DEIN|nr:guanylate kinase [Thermus thermamylovorans]TBH20865.1 guanylate kinase [Thermus thermamylovorans]